jgi:hypothetical protein
MHFQKMKTINNFKICIIHYGCFYIDTLGQIKFFHVTHNLRISKKKKKKKLHYDCSFLMVLFSDMWHNWKFPCGISIEFWGKKLKYILKN